MSEVELGNLQTFYQQELPFVPGDTVIIYMQDALHSFLNVVLMKILILSDTYRFVILETQKGKVVFEEWAGIAVQSPGGTEFQVG